MSTSDGCTSTSGTLELAAVFDTAAMQSLMDDFHNITGFGIGIIDRQGQVLVGTGWQEICTKFHRAHPDACRKCLESDSCLSHGVAAGEFKLYKCKNNLWDMSTPIMVDGNHIGNIFLGQFLFEDETVDRQQFIRQAQEYGFDEQAYLAALDRVPRWHQGTVQVVMAFYAKLAVLVSSLSTTAIKLARTVAKHQRSEAALAASEAKFAKLFMANPSPAAISDFTTGKLIDVNAALVRTLGYSREELIGRSSRELNLFVDYADRARLLHGLHDEGVMQRLESRVNTKTGEVRTLDLCGQRIRVWKQDMYFILAADITERQQAELEREATVKFLRLINENQSTNEMVRAAAVFLQRLSGCEPVGVRLDVGDDQPYYEAYAQSPEYRRRVR